ncbi:class I SAM-dependent methyltransferase [Blastococcus sp. SYSU DS0539]
MQAEDWDRRYAEQAQWSTGPNDLVAELLANLRPGRAVDLAAGEGRHALWLADRGWQVTAVDFSGVGLDRGRARPGGTGSGG